jgi:hypothetical protein
MVIRPRTSPSRRSRRANTQAVSELVIEAGSTMNKAPSPAV